MRDVLAILVGLALLGLVGAAWTGAWRGWRRRALWADGGLLFGLLGGLGIIAVGLGIGGLSDSAAPGGVALVLGILIMVRIFWAPRWAQPTWARGGVDRPEPNLSDPITTFAVAATADVEALRAEAPELAELDAEPTVERWAAAWVFGDEGGARDSAPFGRAGVATGHLLVTEEAVAFRPSDADLRARGSACTFRTPLSDVTGASAVPARTGHDGRPTAGRRVRSAYARLLVQTEEHGTFVFEVAGARRKAATLASHLRPRQEVGPA